MFNADKSIASVIINALFTLGVEVPDPAILEKVMFNGSRRNSPKIHEYTPMSPHGGKPPLYPGRTKVVIIMYMHRIIKDTTPKTSPAIDRCVVSMSATPTFTYLETVLGYRQVPIVGLPV